MIINSTGLLLFINTGTFGFIFDLSEVFFWFKGLFIILHLPYLAAKKRQITSGQISERNLLKCGNGPDHGP